MSGWRLPVYWMVDTNETLLSPRVIICICGNKRDSQSAGVVTNTASDSAIPDPIGPWATTRYEYGVFGKTAVSLYEGWGNPVTRGAPSRKTSYEKDPLSFGHSKTTDNTPIGQLSLTVTIGFTGGANTSANTVSVLVTVSARASYLFCTSDRRKVGPRNNPMST